jgi:uncharacterized protein (DUF1800 family)
MLPTVADPLRIALNRLTFGARDLDVLYVNQIGLTAWLAEQFAAPQGDDPDLAAHLSTTTMRIAYAASDPANTRASWPAVDEFRTLAYIDADIPTLWSIATLAGTKYSPTERTRIRQELLAATWIRNAHSKYQLREFMTDFWNNHFNIGKNESDNATALLPVWDRGTIRLNAFGNFRTLLEATATSPSMLIYLDNATSTAATPNENYAREIMELHTLGGESYLGTTLPANGGYAVNGEGVLMGFTDQDVLTASRALSGWTIQYGQRVGQTTLPSNGVFTYNAAQHNTKAGKFLNVDLAGSTGAMDQGRKVIDLLAYHPFTAHFIVKKLCVRIFGDTPPDTAVQRGIDTWLANKTTPNQIQKVLEAIILGGTEIYTAPVAKIRRPYERIIALARTTDTVMGAVANMQSALDPLNDAAWAWPAPDGRPDTNAYWLATGAMLTTWNLLIQFPSWSTNVTTLAAQTPASAKTTATAVVEYWVGRMLGSAPANTTMAALINDQSGPRGVPTAARSNNANNVEVACRRLVSLIATSEEFSLR